MDSKLSGALIGFFGGFWYSLLTDYYLKGIRGSGLLVDLFSALLFWAPVGVLFGYLYDKEKESKIKTANIFWYILILLFGLIAGIVGYFALKDKNKRLANWFIVIGIIINIVEFIILRSIGVS